MRRRNSSKRSAKAAELVSESVAGAMTTTGPSSTLKIACSMPVLGCFAGGERWVRTAFRVAGLTADVHPGSQWLVAGYQWFDPYPCDHPHKPANEFAPDRPAGA